MYKNGRKAARLVGFMLALTICITGVGAYCTTAPGLVCVARGEASPSGTADESELQKQFEAAQALFDAGKYEEAYNAFTALGDYGKSKARAADSRRKWRAESYKLALSLYKEGKYVEAREIFVSLENYEKSRAYVKDCDEMIQRENYLRAWELFEAGDYDAAYELFTSAGRYKDSRERAKAALEKINERKQAEAELALYNTGLELMQAGDLDGAFRSFLEAGDCNDATDQFHAVRRLMAMRDAYDKAEGCFAEGAYEDARDIFNEILDYEDSAERAKQCMEASQARIYKDAKAAQDADAGRAYIMLLSLEDYEDSAELAEALKPDVTDKSVYEAAEALAQDGEPTLAQIGFEAARGYMDGGARAEQLADEIHKAKEFKRAQLLRSIGEEEQANAIFEALGDYNNASAYIMPLTPRFTTKQLRDYATSPVSSVFTAPDGTKHCYRIYKGVPTWVQARAFCEVLGGHLATLTSDEENQFVHNFMLESGFKTAYFGLSDENRSGDWIWVTGEPFEYTNWHKGEPSYSGREKYGMYFYKHTKGTWNDAHFYEYTEDPGCSYICEWDLQ